MTDRRIPIPQVAPNTTYEVELAYRDKNGVLSAFSPIGTGTTDMSIDFDTVSGVKKPEDNATVNRITTGTTAPIAPINGDIWIDTNVPVTIKTRVSGLWIPGGNIPTALNQVNPTEASKLAGVAVGATKNVVSSGLLAARPAGTDGDFYYATDTQLLYQKISGSWTISANNYNDTSQLTDGAGLGQTAVWSNVSGTGKPADNATVNRITTGTTAPASPINGDIWVDTNPPVTIKTRISGLWIPGGNVPTALNQVNPTEASKLAGVAVGSTKNIVSTGLFSARPVGSDGDFYYATDTLQLFQKVSGSWFESGTVGARVGVNIFPGSGSTPLPGTQLLNEANPLGENQVVNSDLNQGLNGFEFVFASGTNLTGPGLSTNGGRNLVGSVPAVNYFGARNVFWSTASVSSGNFTGGTYLENFRQLGISGPSPSNLRRYATQVIPGERIYYSAKISVHGMTTAVAQVNFYDRDGAYLSTASTSLVIGDARTGGPNAQWGLPSNFATVGGFATVPANAVFAAMGTSGNTLNGAQPSVLVFSCDYFVAKVGADQTAIPAYNAGPVDRAADRTGENTAGGFTGQGTEATVNRFRQATTPTSPNEGDWWFDTSTSPVTVRRRVGGIWLFHSQEGADITAISQRTIVPQFPVIEIRQGEAGHTGSRTVTHSVVRGTTTITGGTYSLPTFNLGSGSATINSSTGTVTLSGIVQSGSYTIRYVHTDGITTELNVNVTYVSVPSGTAVDANKGAVSNAGMSPDNNWQTIASVVLANCPSGYLAFDGSFCNIVSGNGTLSVEARITVNGVLAGVVQTAQPAVSGGSAVAADFSDTFQQFLSVSAGNRTVAFQLRRTAGGAGDNITETATRFLVQAINIA